MSSIHLYHLSTAASIWFEIWGSWIRVKKYRFFQANFQKFRFVQAIAKKNRFFPGKFYKF